LSALAADLVRGRVTVIVANGTPSAMAAKAATATIPTVFAVAVDPVTVGLVESLRQPGGNLTGVTNLKVEIEPKRLELAHELLPAATIVAVLVNPTSPSIPESTLRSMQPAARALGLQLQVLNASTDKDLEKAFASLAQLRADALVIGPDVFFNTRSEQLAARFATRYRLSTSIAPLSQPVA
jgi:putative ABC transport system substrate-binding protein